MSLDVYLTVDDEEVYWANITHNLSLMANKAGIYKPLWRPELLGFTEASQLVTPLSVGVMTLLVDPERFKTYNPLNGWGTYEDLVLFVRSYAEACRMHPTAKIRVSR